MWDLLSVSMSSWWAFVLRTPPLILFNSIWDLKVAGTSALGLSFSICDMGDSCAFWDIVRYHGACIDFSLVLGILGV